MAPTLTLHQGEHSREFTEEPVMVLTVRAVDALKALVPRMAEDDPLRRAVDLLGDALDLRCPIIRRD